MNQYKFLYRKIQIDTGNIFRAFCSFLKNTEMKEINL